MSNHGSWGLKTGKSLARECLFKGFIGCQRTNCFPLLPDDIEPFMFTTFSEDGTLGINMPTDTIVGYSLDFAQIPCEWRQEEEDYRLEDLILNQRFLCEIVLSFYLVLPCALLSINDIGTGILCKVVAALWSSLFNKLEFFLWKTVDFLRLQGYQGGLKYSMPSSCKFRHYISQLQRLKIGRYIKFLKFRSFVRFSRSLWKVFFLGFVPTFQVLSF